MESVTLEADSLLPLVLHFAKEYLQKKDFKKLLKNFDGKDDLDLEDDKFVKATGGIQGLLENFLANNEDAAEKLLGIKSEKKDKKKKREAKADKKEKEKNVRKSRAAATR